MITSLSTVANSTEWDFVTHYTAFDALVPKNIVVDNNRVFDGLGANVQTAYLKATTTVEVHDGQKFVSEAEAETKALADYDMIVVQPSEVLVSGLQAIGATMLDNWKVGTNPDAFVILSTHQE